MRLRAETYSVLRFINEQEFPISALMMAREVNMAPNTLRSRLLRLAEEGYLRSEQRLTQVSNRMELTWYFWISTAGKAELDKRGEVADICSRKRQGGYMRPMINSVWAYAAAA